MARNNYWLVSGQVLTVDGARAMRTTNLNALVPSKEPGKFTRQNLATAQEALSRRYVEGLKQDDKGGQIVDVFIMSVSNLGVMSPAEFHAGFKDAG